MAGGRSAVPPRVGNYDVFVSHRGPDCKKDFADLLRDDLERAGVRCFFDEDSLKVGDVAAEKMMRAMEEATYGLVILSPRFFESEWCMKELETFVRRGWMVPVFFGSFDAIKAAAAAATKERVWERFDQFVKTEEEYRRVVETSFTFTGVRLEEDGWWRSCIRRVRNEVLSLLGKVGGGPMLSEDELLVGQEQHLKELKELLGLPGKGGAAQSAKEVGIVGVRGMGGVGKTTMALKLYDDPDVRDWFTGGVCWLEVGQKPSDDKAQNLQKQILKQLLDVDEDPGNPTLGRELIRQRLGGKRVLICLDDVWEPAFVAKPIVRISDLGAGSRILKTSRMREAIGGQIHDLDSLESEPAWELFCWHAFGGEKPPEDLAEGAEKAAWRCGGLPLALRVLGRKVAEAEDKRDCLATFLELPRDDDAMVACRSIIRTSYENLPLEPSGLGDVFVLVAGVWPRTLEFMDHQRAVENLGAAVYGDETSRKSHILARNALNKLESLSLLGLHWVDIHAGLSKIPIMKVQVTVHDLIADVAETIADQTEHGRRRFFRQPEGPDKLRLPRCRSQLDHISLRSGSISPREVKATCSLILGPDTKLVDCDGPVLDCSCRLLVVGGHSMVGALIMRDLQCLRLRGGFFDHLPARFEELGDLRVLEITYCEALRSLPESVGALTGLTSLDLWHCKALQSLPESVGALTGLTSLDLRGCEALQSLPESVGALTGLTSLNLWRCTALQSLPESVGQLTGLTSLDLWHCKALQSLPESVGALTGLTSLDLRGCEALQSLPESVGALTGLTSLTLGWCKALQSLPESVGALTGLTSLELAFCKALQSLPESVGQLTGLTSLNLVLCEALQSLPESVGALTGLTSLDLWSCQALRGASRYWWAAAQGHAHAQNALGSCYLFGEGVGKDPAQAVAWWRKAADQGDVGAKANLAEFLMEGLAGPPDWVRALQLFEPSLDVNAASKVTSAWMLWGGDYGIQQDRQRARRMCEEVLRVEDHQTQLDAWVAVGWTWPKALEWFEGRTWRNF